MKILKILVNNLKGSKVFALLLAFNMTLGAFGLLFLNTFRESVLSSVRAKSKEFLAADMAFYSRNPISEKVVSDVESQLPENFERAKMIEMYTMVKGKDRSRLVLLSLIEPSFPFYGEFEMGSGRTINHNSTKEIFDAQKIWVYPELLLQLGLVIGDKVKIGALDFEITDTVEKSVGQTGNFAALAPIIYLDINQLEKIGLMKKGSTAWRSYLYQLPNYNESVEELVKNIDKSLTEPGIRVTGHESASESASRVLLYLNDYLGLVGLVALFLASVGAIYLTKNYLWNQLKNMAIYKSLGLSQIELKSVYFIEVILISLASIIPASAITYFLLPVAKNFLYELSLFELEVSLSQQSILLLLVILSIVTGLVVYPLLQRVASLKANQLFQEGQVVKAELTAKDYLMYLPLVLTFWVLAIWQSQSYKIGSIFMVVLLLTVLVLYIFYKILEKFVFPRTLKFSWVLKFTILGIIRRPVMSLSVFLSVGISVFLLSFILNTENSLQSEVDYARGDSMPSLFMFDIQEEQVRSLQEITDSTGVKIANLSPMVRSKLVRVNGENFEKLTDDSMFQSREKEREERFRNRGMNLSYRKEISNSEQVIEGETYPGVYDENSQELPYVSLESRFAKRLGLKLGDKLTFDVQGVEVASEVKNIRRIRWTSFQPNFFIQFQDQVLNEAPKTFIATIPPLTDLDKMNIQTKIVDKLPNISIVDVSRLVTRIIEIFEKMSIALKFMAILSILAGLAVVLSIAQSLGEDKKKDSVLLKSLGMDLNEIVKIQFLETFILSSFGAMVGGLFSFVVVYFSTQVLFQSPFQAQFLGVFSIIICISLVTSLVSTFFVRKTLKDQSKVGAF